MENSVYKIVLIFLGEVRRGKSDVPISKNKSLMQFTLIEYEEETRRANAVRYGHEVKNKI